MAREILIEEDNIPWLEMRGRKPSREYLLIRRLRPDKSFVSDKSRDTLYQLAHKAGRGIRTSWVGVDEETGRPLWRVFVDPKKDRQQS
jgi:hypothetical protein